jgi:transglutaminase-like putative cysteine protease
MTHPPPLTRRAGFVIPVPVIGVIIVCVSSVLAVLASVGTALAGAAGDHPWLVFESTGAPSADRSTADIEALLRAPPPAADSEYPYEDSTWRLHVYRRANGIDERRLLWVRRFLSEAGTQSAGELRFLVQSQRSHVVIRRAFTRGARGRRVPVTPDAVQVVTPQGQRIFSDLVEVVVPFPALEPGAVAVLEVVIEIRNDDWPLPWSDLNLTASYTPVREYEFVVQWDPAVPAPVWRTDADWLACEQVAARTLRCAGTPGAPTPWDPQVETVWDIGQHVAIAEPATWQEIADRERVVVEQQAVVDDAVRSRAAALLDGVGGPRERVRRLYRFVADEVRYVGLEHGTSAIVPRPAAVTLEQRYGDCKDKVTLFLALARAAGLRARAVLVSASLYDLERLLLPSWQYFNHMIVCVELADGDVCLELTSNTFPTGVLPVNVGGAVALDLVADGPGPRRLPAAERAWTATVESDNEVGCDGSVRERRVTRYESVWAASLRAAFQTLSEEQRARLMQDEFREVVGDRLLPHVQLGALDDPEAALRVELTVDFPRRAPVEGAGFYAEPDVWLARVVQKMKTGNRYHPFRLRGLRYATTYRYRLCDEVVPGLLGPTLRFESDVGTLRRTYRRERDTMVVETMLDLPSRVLVGADRDRFNRFADLAAEQSRIWFGLRRRAP